ncbi:hypothetical protein [Larkinella ripae]
MKFTQVARASVWFVFLSSLFARCTMPDHYAPQESCSEVKSLLASCKTGYRLLAIVNQKTSVRSAPTEPVYLTADDLKSMGSECFFKGNPVVESTANGIKIADATNFYEYGCDQ